MSMIGCFRTVTDSEITALIERPQRILRLFELPEEEPRQGLLARLFGKRSQRSGRGDNWQPNPDNEEFDVDKAWHGIHFLLTGTAYAGEPPLNFVVSGGREIGDIDVGYGPARVLTHEEVASVFKALEPITEETLMTRCDRAAFQKHDIYPNIWNEPDEECFGYVLHYFGELKEFVKRTRDSGKGLVVHLS